MRDFFGGDPYFSNVALQLPLRSHFRDEAKAPTLVTVNGDTKLVNDAAYFDGDGDYCALSSTVASALASGPVTIEGWLKLNATPWVLPVGNSTNYGSAVLAQNNNSGSGEQYIDVGTNYKIFFGRAGSWSPSYYLYAVTAFTPDQWGHFAFVYTGSVLNLYINGKLDAQTAATTFWSNNGQPLEFARCLVPSYPSYKIYFNGYIRDFRITKGVRYTSNFTPPTALPTHGVTKLNRRIPLLALPEAKRPPLISRNSSFFVNSIDWSNPITRGLILAWAAPYGEAPEGLTPARLSDGSGKGSITTPVTFGRGAVLESIPRFSYYGLVKQAAASYRRNLWSKGDYFSISSGYSISSALFVYPGGSSSYYSSQVDGFFTAGAKTGVGVFVDLSSTDTGKAYKNGLYVSAFSFSGNAPATSSSTADFYPLGNSSTEQSAWNGDVYLTYFWNRELSATEFASIHENPYQIFRHHARRIPTYMKSAVRRAPIMAMASVNSGDKFFNNVLLNAPLRTDIRDYSKYTRVFTQGGGVVVNQEATYFDGVNDTLTSSAFDLLPYGDFTIEFEGKWPASAGERRVFAVGGGLAGWNSSTGLHLLLQINGTNSGASTDFMSFQYWNGSSGTGIGSSVPIPNRSTAFTRVVVQKRGSEVTMYFNSALVMRNTVNMVRPSATPAVGIFCIPGEVGGFIGHGWVRNVRVTAGVCRYADTIGPVATLPTSSVAAPYGIE